MASSSSEGEEYGVEPQEFLGRNHKKKRRKYRKVRYTVEEKEKVVDLMDRGWRNCDIQRALGIPESTLRAFRKRKEELKKDIQPRRNIYHADTSPSNTLENEFIGKPLLIPTTEHLLVSWAHKRLMERGTVDDKTLRDKALRLFRDLCRENAVIDPPAFTASSRWLAQFKEHYGPAISSGLCEDAQPDQYQPDTPPPPW